MIERIKFVFLREWKRTRIILKYLMLEPFYEIRDLLDGSSRSVLVFYFAVFLFFWMWHRNILGRPLQIMGILVFLTYVYMFVKSNKWKEYYEKSFEEK